MSEISLAIMLQIKKDLYTVKVLTKNYDSYHYNNTLHMDRNPGETDLATVPEGILWENCL